jgi:hypothetical protein
MLEGATGFDAASRFGGQLAGKSVAHRGAGGPSEAQLVSARRVLSWAATLDSDRALGNCTVR